MMAARLTVLLALAFACGAASPLAQTPRPQAARDQPREAVGTGSIAGVVVDAAADHHPLRRALVTLHGDALVSPRVVASDDTGRFAFDALPASTYTLSASKAGYVYGNYGAARPGRPGLSIVIADAARRTDVSIALAKGAVITGTVTDERGAPLVDVFITLLRRDVVDGVRRFVDTYQAVFTDARGAYRVYGLAAGDYALLVSRSEVSRRPTDFSPIAEGEIDLALAAARAGTPPPAPPNTGRGRSASRRSTFQRPPARGCHADHAADGRRAQRRRRRASLVAGLPRRRDDHDAGRRAGGERSGVAAAARAGE